MRKVAIKWILAVLADHRVKIKETEKRIKYISLARKLKKLLYVRMMVIPIIINAREKVP